MTDSLTFDCSGGKAADNITLEDEGQDHGRKSRQNPACHHTGLRQFMDNIEIGCVMQNIGDSTHHGCAQTQV